jgi:hypothetical protein
MTCDLDGHPQKRRQGGKERAGTVKPTEPRLAQKTRGHPDASTSASPSPVHIGRGKKPMISQRVASRNLTFTY